MTFVTIVPCAHVTGTGFRLFFYSDKFLSHARKGLWRHSGPGRVERLDISCRKQRALRRFFSNLLSWQPFWTPMKQNEIMITVT